MGEKCYPAEGTGDWKGFFHTFKEAESNIISLNRFPNKESKLYFKNLNSMEYDWYEIVNLEEWMNK